MFEQMKFLNKHIFYLLALLVIWSCNESEDLMTEDAKTGGIVESTSVSNSYVVGNSGPYTMEFLARQDPDVQIESIDVYKSFEGTDLFTDIDGKDSVVAYSSNEVLDRTIEITNTSVHFFSTAYMFDELRANLVAKGAELPVTDGGFRIGDKFVFRVVAHLSDGRQVTQNYNVAFTVSTRYAGKYKAVDAEYYRIHVLTFSTADWPAETVIESVDATTYKVVEYFGPAGFSGNTYYFQIIDGVITYPDNAPDGSAQLGNGQPFITCQTNAADFAAEGLCDDTNYVVNDDLEGKDRLYMTFGYFTPGSGPRTFYQVLEKIVD